MHQRFSELLTNNGYFSEANVNACTAAEVGPMIAMGREAHHPSLAERFAEVLSGWRLGWHVAPSSA